MWTAVGQCPGVRHQLEKRGFLKGPEDRWRTANVRPGGEKPRKAGQDPRSRLRGERPRDEYCLAPTVVLAAEIVLGVARDLPAAEPRYG